MLAREEDVEAAALRAQGWSISAIARHLGRDRGTVRSHLNGERTPGVRRKSVDDPFDRFAPYVAQRLKDDPHLQLSTLLREIEALGFSESYQTLTRQVRSRDLRPHCEACAGAKGRATTEIEHPPGAETQLDWLELGEAPWGGTALLLVGALAHSAKARGWFSEAKDTAHLIAAMDGVFRRLGGLTKRVRIDAIEGGVIPGTRTLVPAFADACRHYGVGVDICPARRGNRKGVVEKANDYITQAWWRTADVTTPEQAQASLDGFCSRVGDLRPREQATVGVLAAAERLRPVPREPYRAVIEVLRKVSWGALVSFEGNRYSVPPAFVDATVIVSHRLGAPTPARWLRGPGPPGRERGCAGANGPGRVLDRAALPAQGEPSAVGGGEGARRGAHRGAGPAAPSRRRRPRPLRGADAPCPMTPSTSDCAPTWPT